MLQNARQRLENKNLSASFVLLNLPIQRKTQQGRVLVGGCSLKKTNNEDQGSRAPVITTTQKIEVENKTRASLEDRYGATTQEDGKVVSSSPPATYLQYIKQPWKNRCRPK